MSRGTGQCAGAAVTERSRTHAVPPTLQAICAAACFCEDWPLLVVAPSSMLLTWFEALAAWLPPRCCPAPGDMIVVTSSKVGRVWGAAADAATLPAQLHASGPCSAGVALC